MTNNAPLAGALEMAALGFPVFPLKPGTKDGFLSPSWKAQATTDSARIQALAARHPGCNWGARCSGHMVLDVDVTNGKQGEASLLLVDMEHGLPVTRAHRSARGGLHLFLRMPAGLEATNRSAPLGEGVDVRGSGGFVVCPGSTFDGHPYTVESTAPVAEAPASLVALLRAPDAAKGREVPAEHMDHPAAIAGAVEWLLRRPGATKGERGSHVYKAATRLRDWGLSHDVALDLIGEHYAPNMDPPADVNFCRHEVASAYQYAQNTAGARSVTVDFDDVSELAEELATPEDAPPIAKGEQLRWPITDEDGKPLSKEHANIKAFLRHIGATVYRDEFSGRDMLEGTRDLDGPFSDDAMVALHQDAFDKGLRPPKEHFKDALKAFALRQRRHPVREYLDGMQWDGTSRIASWLSQYLGADDTPLHREFGRLWLVAAVRRVRQPGCKFDNMLVLEGTQGAGKSTALKILAGEWFDASLTLSAEPKVIIEQTRGKWVLEVPELSGMASREAEHVKALLSRDDDTGRGAYREFPENVKRQFVLAGTTNDDSYLRDTTGNRRYWPVKVGKVDLEGLARDRDQLWAEAAAVEAQGGSLMLPEGMWTVAAAAQAERETIDPLRDVLEQTLAGKQGYVPAAEALALCGWSVAHGRVPTTNDGRRVAAVMKQIGWTRKKRRIEGGAAVWVFQRWPEGSVAPPPHVNLHEPSGSPALVLVGGTDVAAAAAADLLG